MTDLLGDFDFDGRSSKAYVIGAIQYPLVLEMIDAQAPLHAFDTPTPGSGKGLLADVISIVTYG